MPWVCTFDVCNMYVHMYVITLSFCHSFLIFLCYSLSLTDNYTYYALTHAKTTFVLTCRAGQYQKFHIMIIMTVNMPIINIIAISAELIVSVLQALKL